MVRTASCFAQVLGLIDRMGFAGIVRKVGAERNTKGFRCWDQFVAMLFCHLGRANSLREICGGLATALGRVVHLGMNAAPKRSTLAYANEHRSWKVFEGVFYQLLGRVQAVAASKRRSFRFKNPLRILDSTVIELCVEVFDWARFQRTKGAIKLHLQLDDRGHLPCWALITEGRTHDVAVAQHLEFAPGTIVVMDRAYTDYGLWARWTREGEYFVTRLKSSARFEPFHWIPGSATGPVRREAWIRIQMPAGALPLRLVVAWDAKRQEEVELVTNLVKFSATTIAQIYRHRWQIELFFKALKQTLKIKTFVGTSENAVKTQVWTALIAMLLLKVLQLTSSWGWSLSNLAALLRMNLLTYRDLWAWLDDPFGVPVQEPGPVQLELPV